SVYLAQVGDSRAYIIRAGQVKQVTEDQSWANAVKRAGLETKDVPSNVILQALGTQPRVHVEVTSVELRSGDLLLLCSDGLSNKLKDTEMREIVGNTQELPDSCRQLIDLANKRGGEDNITVIVVRFLGEELSIQAEPGSITSTFKVVNPLDFSDSIDGNETMSFREPVEAEEAMLPDHVPTLSDLPQLPELPDLTTTGSYLFSDKAKEASTAPLPQLEKDSKDAAKDPSRWKADTKPQPKVDEAMLVGRKGNPPVEASTRPLAPPVAPAVPPPPPP